MSITPRPRAGFTLVELLVVIAILAVLAGLLLAGVQQVRESANRAACENNLRQLALGVQNFEGSHGTMPPYATGMPGTPYANWFMYIADSIEQGRGANGPGLFPAAPTPKRDSVLVTSGAAENVHFKVLVCPSDPSTALETYWGKTSYLANWYAFGDGKPGYFRPPQRFADLSNGLSNVVLFAEAYSYCNQVPRLALNTPWYHTFGVTPNGEPGDDPSLAPKDYTLFQVRPAPATGCDNWRTQTPHTVMHAALADGSVRSVAGGVSPITWKQALKPRGTAPLPGDW